MVMEAHFHDWTNSDFQNPRFVMLSQIGNCARRIGRRVDSGFRFYGSAMSCTFLARGREVVYPKDMSMMIGLGTREKQPVARLEPTAN
jgi:hypothetical protein